jgi:hypothetical protein
VRIFNRKSRTRRTLGSYQIRVFRHRSKQLIGREARRELEEASEHVLGVEASPEATLTVTKHRPSCLSVARLCCRPPPIKVSLIEFRSSLWSRRSKPHRKPTTMAWENLNSGKPSCSDMACRREHEPASPPPRSQPPRRPIFLVRPRLEAGHRFMWFVDWCAGTPWARSTGP